MSFETFLQETTIEVEPLDIALYEEFQDFENLDEAINSFNDMPAIWKTALKDKKVNDTSKIEVITSALIKSKSKFNSLINNVLSTTNKTNSEGYLQVAGVILEVNTQPLLGVFIDQTKVSKPYVVKTTDTDLKSTDDKIIKSKVSSSKFAYEYKSLERKNLGKAEALAAITEVVIGFIKLSSDSESTNIDDLLKESGLDVTMKVIHFQ